MTYITNKLRGFTLVETLVYIAGVVLILGLIVDMLFYAYRWYGSIAGISRVDQVGISLVDRLMSDVRSGQDVSGGSSFGTDAGSLTVTAMTAPGTTISKRYFIQNDRLAYTENGGYTQYLTPDDLTISAFHLDQLITPVSRAVRFSIHLDYLTRTGTSTNTYSGMAIMRNSYQ